MAALTLRQEIQARVAAALAACNAEHEWNLPAELAFEVTRPRNPDHGDFSANVAMTAAAALRKSGVNLPPREVAAQIADRLPKDGAMAEVDVAGPGFLNLKVAPAWFWDRVADTVLHPSRTGRLDVGQGRRIQVEFVSANPTGPLHFGGARNAVLGDGLARVMEACGYSVQREFYVNDAGAQFDLFVQSLLAACVQLHGGRAEFPPDGYRGAYMHEYAAAACERLGTDWLADAEGAADALRGPALDIVLEDVRSEISLLGIEFDQWFSERGLHESGQVEAAIARLADQDAVYRAEGAVWFAASRYEGNDQDVVLVRSNGAPTYFAADAAYHWDKLRTRGFDRVLNVWSVDHQGHVPRMQALVEAMGLDRAKLKIVLYDLVKLVRDGNEVAMSKRSGSFLTLREVVAEVGADAVRFMLLTRAPESVVEFDLARAVEQNPENPVYFVQYSHARLCSILVRAQAEGLLLPDADDIHGHLRTHLGHPAELELARLLTELGDQLLAALERSSPHNLTYYAMRIASAVNGFYRDCRVLDRSRPGLSGARLCLCDAARIVLARILHLLGVHAPASM